jgi:hypothetical protein
LIKAAPTSIAAKRLRLLRFIAAPETVFLQAAGQ